MHDPREPHLALIKRILRYVKDTLAYGLQLHTTSPLILIVYFDANWADSCRSTLGYCVYLSDNLIS